MPLTSIPRRILTQIRNDFDLDSIRSHHFFKSEWELIHLSSNEEEKPNVNWKSNHNQVSLWYLIYRGIYMLLLNSSITASTLCQSHLFHIFLTNWSFTLQNTYAILSFGSILWRYLTLNRRLQSSSLLKLFRRRSGNKNFDGNLNDLKPERKDDATEKDRQTHEQLVLHDIESPATPGVVVDVECQKINDSQDSEGQISTESKYELTIVEKAIWLIINVVHVLPYCVVLGYWCFVYKYDPDQPFCEKFRSHYIVHGATAILAFIDTLIIAIPARFFHFLIPTTLLFVYVLFTGLYELGGGPYRNGKDHIYSILDWKNNPKKALTVGIIGVILSPLAHTLFCWGIYKLRLVIVSIYRKLRSKI